MRVFSHYLSFLRSLLSQIYQQQYLEFSDQKETVAMEAINFATLKSGTTSVVPPSKFTICGSIFINFYRAQLTFYTLRKKDHTTLWFSVGLIPQLESERYQTFFSVYDNSFIGSFLNLKPQMWSHVCTFVDMYTGHVMISMNGVMTHDIHINNTDFRDNIPEFFEKNLILGLGHEKYPGSPDEIRQSEASVTDQCEYIQSGTFYF